MHRHALDLAGIGVGPFNLSVAALAGKLSDHRTRFFERKPGFSWHAGLMLPHAYLQTSWMKDLVTPVDPTNPHSFLNYLVAHNRFYAFINAEQPAIHRAEFADYLRWVAQRLPHVAFDHDVCEVRLTDRGFALHTHHGVVMVDNLCVGSGVRPFVPECARSWPAATAFHAYHLAARKPNLSGLRVAVVGGGQTGAEIVAHLLQQADGPRRLYWVSRRPNLEPLDESPFTNEYFVPDYVDTFHGLPADRKPDLVAYQKLASDGISPETLKLLYRHLYHQRLTGAPGPETVILPDRTLVDGSVSGDGYHLTLHNNLHDAHEQLAVDLVIFCTGFRAPLPDCLAPLAHRLESDPRGGPVLDRDYAMRWDGPAHHRIFAVNAGKHSHGIADPQTSLMAWRAATILNALAGREVYHLGDTHGFLHWAPLETATSAADVCRLDAALV